MGKRLTKAQLEARGEALHEAAEHLYMDWTDDPIEHDEGIKMATRLESESIKWGMKALLKGEGDE